MNNCSDARSTSTQPYRRKAWIVLFGSILIFQLLPSCAGDDGVEESEESVRKPARQALTRVSPTMRYTPLTDAERAHATQPIWKDPQFRHLKPSIKAGKLREMKRRKSPHAGFQGVIQSSGFEQAWESEETRLETIGKSEVFIKERRASFKASYFAK